jgi:hydrogenase maturation factor
MSPASDSAAPWCETEEGCITCGDVAVELEVITVDEARGLALCRDEDGRRETVETALVEGVETGTVLLVHAGTALATVQAPCMPGREAEETRHGSRLHPDPRSPAPPRGAARGGAVVGGFQ